MTTLTTTLAAMVIALAPFAVAAQDQAVDTTEKPAWPAPLQSWQSKDRDPVQVTPDAAERLGLTEPDVQESLMPPPTQQGTRPPEPVGEAQEQPGWTPLYKALNQTRRAPVTPDGQRLRRPNALASEPTTEMTPLGGPDSLFPEGYVE